MDALDGITMHVEEIDSEHGFIVSEGIFFHPDWCEKVEEPIAETNKTIDWEQRRYEIAKDFMTAQINSLYLSGKSKGMEWNYKDEARYAINAADVLIKQLHSPEN
ncbi:MAG: hypothetical protein AB7E45_04330 [Candidatus Caldatribacteriota bacterium]